MRSMVRVLLLMALATGGVGLSASSAHPEPECPNMQCAGTSTCDFAPRKKCVILPDGTECTTLSC